jgi:hypothetical protein
MASLIYLRAEFNVANSSSTEWSSGNVPTGDFHGLAAFANHYRSLGNIATRFHD